MPEPVIDYYETEISCEAIGKSSGWFVYMDRTENLSGGGSMDRLTPDQARALAAQLTRAAGEAEKGAA
ncbi:MAG TPA: hypothetical protein VFJ76_07865 [Solirubrobacterales bacterium]|nr:hypothetical protein [Solirubrobacterales bacterium]